MLGMTLHLDPLARTVVARHLSAFAAPAMAQVKTALQNMDKAAMTAESRLKSFRARIQDEADYYFDSKHELIEDLTKKLDPIVEMVRVISIRDTLAMDNVGDVRKAGVDIGKLCKAAMPEQRDNRAMFEAIKTVSEMAETFVDESDLLLNPDILPPEPWWTRNAVQITRAVEAFASDGDDKGLGKDLAKLPKAIEATFKVGANAEKGFGEIRKILRDALDALKDVKAPSEAKGPKKPKRPTFAEVRKVIFERLRKEGWKLEENLKIPHATSPDGETRLWFKSQAVYINDKGTDPRAFKNTHSRESDLRDLADPDRFMRAVAIWTQ